MSEISPKNALIEIELTKNDENSTDENISYDISFKSTLEKEVAESVIISIAENIKYQRETNKEQFKKKRKDYAKNSKYAARFSEEKQ